MADRKYPDRIYGYNAGSTAPAYEPEKIRKAKRTYVKEANERIEQQVRSRRNEKIGMNLIQTAAAAVFAVAFAAFAWLYMRELFRYRENRLAAEKSAAAYEQLRSENILAANRIESGIDYAAVYDYAVDVLHMTVPMKQQIVYYESTETEYVDRSGEIPDE